MSTPSEEDRVRRSVGSRDVTEWRSRGGRRFLRLQQRVADRSSRGAAVGLTLAVGGAVAVAGVWATTLLYDAVADRDGIARLDRPVLRRAMRLRGPAVDALAAGIARGFGPVGMPVVALAAGSALALRTRSPLPLATTVAAGLGSLAMTIGGKDVVRRHRPPKRDAIAPFEHSPSFPSGHALNATAVVGALAYLAALEQRSNAAQVATAAGAIGVAASVGLSRVLLGAHWFSDVVTGWVAGAGWLGVVVTAHRVRLTLDRG